jgi:hypothetical protein
LKAKKAGRADLQIIKLTQGTINPVVPGIRTAIKF